MSLGTFQLESGLASGVPYVLMDHRYNARWGTIYLLTTICPADCGTQSQLGIISNMEVGFMAWTIQGCWHARGTPVLYLPWYWCLGASWVAQLVKNLPAIQETLVWFLGQEVPPGEGIGYLLQYSWVFLEAQTVKHPPEIWEIWVWSLCWEDPMEGLATHYSILAWRNPMDRGAWWATDHEVTKSQTRLSD